MITIQELAKDLSISERELLDRVVAMQLKLRSRGKALEDEDAEKVRQAMTSQEEDAGDEAETDDAKPSVEIPVVIGIKDLAERLEVSPAEILKILMQNGVIANLNAEIDFDTAGIIADEMGFKAVEEKGELEDDLEEVVGTDTRLQKMIEAEDPAKQVTRPPVITIMGHVDHGKTSLLDAIRKTNVTAGEEGGITQHIGAYQVEKNDRKITFLDTPGHEAFTAMRARGAQVTDIAVLVVAADDGVMPQTVEAVSHARAAGVPIIVAVNKMDKPGADPDRVKRELTEHQLVPEEWGGSTIFVPLSAKQQTGIEDLLEMILLVADIADLKADPDRPALGTVLEAQKTMNRGVTTSVLIQSGTLKGGDPILVGSEAGKVKAMISDTGKKVQQAGPATPVEVLGLSGVPQAGDILQVVEDDRTAAQLADVLARKARAERLRPTSRISLESFYEQQAGQEVKTLNLILKADVQGSVEAIQDSLKKAETEEVKVKVVHAGTGDINASDITLAAASQAVVIGFRVRVSPAAEAAAQQNGVDARTYGVIYKLIEDVQKAMGGLLSPEDIVIVQGRLLVKAVFSENRDRWTVGGLVQSGQLMRGQRVRIRRGDEVLDEADIVSVRRENDNVKEVSKGVECGLMLKRVRQPIKEGDFLEVYIIEQRERTLEESR